LPSGSLSETTMGKEAVFLIWKEVYLEAGMSWLLVKDGGL